jgi:hypothetical protein
MGKLFLDATDICSYTTTEITCGKGMFDHLQFSFKQGQKEDG